MDFDKTDKNFLLILILSCILKIFLVFMLPENIYNIYYWTQGSTLLLEGTNPYTMNEFLSKYPPLFYYVSNFFGMFFGKSLITPKIMIFVFEAGNIIMIFKIGVLLRNRNFGIVLSTFYLLNPLNIIQFYYGENEFVTIFFILTSLYYFFKKKFLISSIFLGLGVCFKIYPIILVIPISIHLLKNYDIKTLVYYIFIGIITIYLICLPFLIIDGELFIEKILIHTSRRHYGYLIDSPFVLSLYDTKVTVFNISFSIIFIIQFIFFVVIFLLGLRCKTFNNFHILVYILIMTYSIPIITFQISARYFGLIFLPIQIIITKLDLDRIEMTHILPSIIILFVGYFISFLINILSFPNIFSDLDSLDPASNQVIFVPLFIYLILILSIVSYSHFEFKYRSMNDWKLFLFSLTPNIIFTVIEIWYQIFGLSKEFLLISLVPIVFIIVYIYRNYWLNAKEVRINH